MLQQSYHDIMPEDDTGTSTPLVVPASSPDTIQARFSGITYEKVGQRSCVKIHPKS